MRILVISIVLILIVMKLAAQVHARRKAHVREVEQSLDDLIRDLRENDRRAASQLLQQEKRASHEPDTQAAWSSTLPSEMVK